MSDRLLVKNAKLRNGSVTDILVEDGKFAKIQPKIQIEQVDTIDAKEHLVSPPFCDAHLHLDAVLSVGRPRYNQSGTLLEGIQIWSELKEKLDKETIKKNAIEVIQWEAVNGSMFLRTHADATDSSGNAVEALLEVKEAVKDFVDLQIVAFPQDCIFTRKGNARMLEDAVEKGCDVVGGLPYIELSPEDGLRDVKYVFDLAEKYDRLIDIHCDENTDDQSRYVEAIARETIVRDMQGRVSASHTTAMHNYNNDFAQKLIGNLKRADLNIITNPFPNSCLQNRTDGYPRHRGHTRVDELAAAGVNVAAGSDDIMDPWYPMGKGSPLTVVNLLMNYAQMSGYDQINYLFDMITYNGAKALGLKGYGIKEGNPADFIILDADSEFDAIRLCSEVIYTVRRGKIIAKVEPAKRTFHGDGEERQVDFKI